jgi:iron(III) transport system substrate-binding protein
MRFGRTVGMLAGSLTLALLASACGGSDTAGSETTSGSAEKPTLVLYNAQHEELTQAVVDGFTQESGIKVELRSGEDPELANQILAEGDASPADVFVTENSPSMTLVAGKGGFAPVDAATKAQVPAQFSAADGSWVGWAARSTVLAYNPTQLQQAQLPASIMELADPAWSGKIGIAAAGADFQAIVSAVLQLKGEAATAAWLRGLKANAKIYQGNNAAMKAVNAGEIQAAVIYHYYWYKDQAESGENTKNVKLLYFGDKDPGAFVGVSGAGVVKSSDHPAEAQALVKYLTSKAGQQIVADSQALEYSLSTEVPTNPALKPMSELDPPVIDIAQLNGPKVVELMTQAGLL